MQKTVVGIRARVMCTQRCMLFGGFAALAIRCTLGRASRATRAGEVESNNQIKEGSRKNPKNRSPTE